jgi:MarR family transcriptional regulator, organic hydroperoxide resistance regulator
MTHPVSEGIASPEVTFGRLLQLVRAVQTGMQNIDASIGLSGSQLWALWLISAQPGLRVTDLAAAMYIHRSTASNLLDKLEAHVLVVRERRDADSRVVRLSLTDLGRQTVRRIPGPMQGRLRSALQALPAPILSGLNAGVEGLLKRISDRDG